MKKFIISIDAGTTSNRAILFDLKGKPIFSSQKEFTQYFPKSGWVEHDPEEIWSTTRKVLKDAILKANDGDRTPYGNDQVSNDLQKKFSEIFEKDVIVYPTTSGTAANALALSTLTPVFGNIFCSRNTCNICFDIIIICIG